MTSPVVPWFAILTGILPLPLGCGGDDSSSDSGTGGAAAVGTGGGVGSGVGGTDTGAGGVTSGSGGSNSGVGGTDATYWPEAYNPAGAPVDDVDADGVYYHANDVWRAPGNCMLCHASLNQPFMAFGGTVFQSDGVTPAAHVQVGVKDGANSYFVYSNAKGHYWAAGANNVNWPGADIRMRNSTGEIPKTSVMERGADCDSCHVDAQLLTIAP